MNGVKAGLVSLLVNAVLFVLKFALGMSVGSVALIADSIHTLSDSLTSLVLILGSFASTKPPDREHPFGHGRAEAVSSLIIAVLLGVAGAEFLKISIERIFAPSPISGSWLVIGIVVTTALVKEALARYAFGLSRGDSNTAIEADAWHHRSDAISTLVVAGGMAVEELGLAAVDGWVGTGVSLFMFKVAWDVGKRSVDVLLGRPPVTGEVDEIVRKAMSVDGVIGVHNVLIHHYGEKRYISLHLEVPPDMTTIEMHSIIHEVEDMISDCGTNKAVVHVDPVNDSHPEKGRIRAMIEDSLKSEVPGARLVRIKMLGSSDEVNISCVIDIPGKKGLADLESRLEEELKKKYPNARLSVMDVGVG